MRVVRRKMFRRLNAKTAMCSPQLWLSQLLLKWAHKRVGVVALYQPSNLSTDIYILYLMCLLHRCCACACAFSGPQLAMHSAFSHGSGAGVTIDDRSNAAARRGEFVHGVSPNAPPPEMKEVTWMDAMLLSYECTADSVGGKKYTSQYMYCWHLHRVRFGARISPDLVS